MGSWFMLWGEVSYSVYQRLDWEGGGEVGRVHTLSCTALLRRDNRRLGSICFLLPCISALSRDRAVDPGRPYLVLPPVYRFATPSTPCFFVFDLFHLQRVLRTLRNFIIWRNVAENKFCQSVNRTLK